MSTAVQSGSYVNVCCNILCTFLHVSLSKFFPTKQTFHYNHNSFFKFIYLFLFGCVVSSLLRTGFLQLQRAGPTLCCSVRASHCSGFSCCGARALGARASVVVERRLSSCGARAQLLCGMWDLLRPGIDPMSPALAGGFLTTAPPGKSP